MNGNKASIDGIASFLNSGENPGNTGMKSLLDHAPFFPHNSGIYNIINSALLKSLIPN